LKQNNPPQKTIPHSRPTLGQAEIDAVSDVIRTGHIAQGEKVRQFEAAMAKEIGKAHAVACHCGTSALHLTLKAMGVRPEDEVVFPSYVCSALLHAVRYVGATPVLADVDPHTCNIDPRDIKKRITKRTKAVIVPHLFGLPAELDPILALGAPVIEDCAQAVGATRRDKKAGSMGHASIFSFYATKVLATGEGGMVLTDDPGLMDRIRDLREYDQKEDLALRYNAKMTDMQAAMGLAQLARLEKMLKKRRDIAEAYYSALGTLPVQLPPREAGHIYYRFVIQVQGDTNDFIRKLKDRNVECSRPVFLPVHRYLRRSGYDRSERLWQQAVSVPIYPTLSHEERLFVIDAVLDAAGGVRLEAEI